MATESHKDEYYGKDRKTTFGKKLASLSDKQLNQVHDDVVAELKRRVKEAGKKKKPSEMDDRAFEAYKSKMFSGEDH